MTTKLVCRVLLVNYIPIITRCIGKVYRFDLFHYTDEEWSLCSLFKRFRTKLKWFQKLACFKLKSGNTIVSQIKLTRHLTRSKTDNINCRSKESFWFLSIVKQGYCTSWLSRSAICKWWWPQMGKCTNTDLLNG